LIKPTIRNRKNAGRNTIAAAEVNPAQNSLVDFKYSGKNKKK
jgi:hypothetical protein